MFFTDKAMVEREMQKVQLENTTVLNEKYFGKDKDTRQIEEEFKNMIAKKGNYNTSKLEKILEKRFGFGTVVFIIEKEKGSISYTFCDVDMSKRTEMVDGEFRFKPGNDYRAFFYFNEEMFNGEFTPEELTAILLHEVGHHFASKAHVFNLNSKTLQSICEAVNELTKLYIVSPDGIGLFKQLIFLGTYLFHLLVFLGIAIQHCVIALDFILSPITAIDLFASSDGRAKIFKRLTNNVSVSMLSNVLVHDEEKISDALPVLLGYGPELTTALGKIEIKIESKSWGLQIMQLWFILPILMCIGFLDPKVFGIHAYHRVQSIVSGMNGELMNATNRDKVNQISKDLKAIEENYINYMDYKIRRSKADRINPPLIEMMQSFMFKNVIRKFPNNSQAFPYDALRRLIKEET